MKIETYKGYKVKSTPHEIVDKGDYKYAVHGIIQVDIGNSVTDIMIENLDVPEDEWKHFTEIQADEAFIKYAKIYIDKHT